MAPNSQPKQILLRGCVLRNVEKVYGVVMYTGKQTKVRVKQTVHNAKRAQVEKLVNKQILFLVMLLVACCIAGTIGYAVWTHQHIHTASYLALTGVTLWSCIKRLLTFFLLNSNFIPVSLYVSMKLARTAQKFFMEKDLGCYYEVQTTLCMCETVRVLPSLTTRMHNRTRRWWSRPMASLASSHSKFAPWT